MYKKIEKCPLCKNKGFKNYLICKDHLVSKESFAIVACEACSFKFTNPRPEDKSLDLYYQSDLYISHENRRNSIINFLYKLARNFTLNKKLRLVNKLAKEEKHILDIGCGTGNFLAKCKRSGWKIDGVEPNEKAREKAKALNGTAIYKDLSAIDESHQYQVITLWHVLEHISRLSKTIKLIKKLLADNGTIVIALPNCNSFDALLYKENWAAYDVPRHLYHFTQESMHLWAESHKLKIKEILPMKLDAYYVSMLSEKYKNNKTNYFRALKNAYQSNRWAAKNQNEFSSLIYILGKKRKNS